jgi:DNA polymerase-1
VNDVHPTLALGLDGTNLAHRVFHAGATTTSAVLHGFTAMVGRLVAEQRPTHLLVALDPPGGCAFRRTLAPEYKAGRPDTDPQLRAALDELPVVLTALGLSAPRVDGWEADDVLASLASAPGIDRTVLVSSDKDLHQLISATVTVRKPEGATLDPQTLVARYGVTSDRWVEFAALVGEGADNLAGVPGIGPKRAAALLAATVDLEEALSGVVDTVAVPPAALRRLADHAELVRRNRQVGTLRRDLPLDLGSAQLTHLDPRAFHAAAVSVGLESACGQLTAFLARLRRPG